MQREEIKNVFDRELFKEVSLLFDIKMKRFMWHGVIGAAT